MGESLRIGDETVIGEIVGRMWWHRFMSREACSWEELEQFPQIRPDERRRVLAERLLAQVRYFGNREDALPEWREAARVSSPDELWKVWPFLPIVTKQTLQTQFPGRGLQSRFHLRGMARSTGGSTGEPTVFFHDEPMMRATNAASTFTRVKMGWRPGMATVKVWGSERDIQRKVAWRPRAYNVLLREMVVDGYCLDDQTVDHVLGLLLANRRAALWGFTSMLDFIAREVVKRGTVLPEGLVSTAWNGGEMLFAEHTENFRKAFGLPILNRYGGRELSVMACQFRDNGPMHVMRPWVFLEVVNDKDLPAAPGESGRLLWTSTICRGTPFLRYEIGDMGAFRASDVDEAGIAALHELHGRSAGILELPDGRTINCLYWNHLLKEFPEVHQFQVILGKDRKLRLLLRGAGFTSSRQLELHTTLTSFLGSLSIDIEWVEQIPVTSRGKLLQVVREGAVV
jgi:phenylacetate-CoA ligase